MADWDVSAEAPIAPPVAPVAATPAPIAAVAPVPVAATPPESTSPAVIASPAEIAAVWPHGDNWDVQSEAPVARQTVGGAAQAAGSGAGSFALDTLGLPVSTVRNVEELGKAAAGAVASQAYTDKLAPGETLSKDGTYAVINNPTGAYKYHWRENGMDVFSKNPPPMVPADISSGRMVQRQTEAPVVSGGGITLPKWLQPEDPNQYQYDIGSPEFLKQQLRSIGGTNLVDVKQKTKLNQYLSAGVEGGLSATIGSEASVPAVARALAVGGTAGAVSEQMVQNGANPAVANAAGLLAGAVMHRTISGDRAPYVGETVNGPSAEDILRSGGKVDPAERILKTPSLPGPSPAESAGAPARASAAAVPDPNTPAAPVAAQEATEAAAGQTPGPTTNNASGESSASAEAISRNAQETAAGQTRHVIDEDGKAMPLVGVDAADAVARPGTIIVQKGVGSEPVTILDRGGLPLAQARGLLNRAQANGELSQGAASAPPGTPGTGGIEVTEHQPATAPEDYVEPQSTHPMRNGQPYAMVSAELSTNTPQENAQRTQLLGQILQASGMRSAPTQGSYQGALEHSYAVQTPSPQAADFVNKVAQQFGQDSVMHVDANQNATLHYGDGRQEWLGGMKQVSAAEAQALPGWTRDSAGNFYTVKPPGAEPATRTTATASQSIYGDPAKTGGASDATDSEQAQRAATFKRIGLPEVRRSAVTGNSKEAASDFQTSKLDSSGGVRLARVQDAERTALATYADKLVSDAGGSKGLAQPDLESRGRKIAAPVDGYDQALEQATQRIYDVAKAVAAGKPITLGGLANMMVKQKSQFLGTVEGKQLLEGVKARMQELGFMGDNDTFNPATVEQAERLRQYIGQQWSPRVTHLVSMLKNHLDNDAAATAGADVFKQAREIRALRAKVLEEPEGIARLIQPKEANKLGINRITDFSDIPHMITQLEPDQFGHVIDTLRVASTSSPELWQKSLTALREIRSQFANEVQAEGNKTAGAWNQKAVNQYLKKNEASMRKVFTSEELGEYRDLDNAGRWLHQDKTYPGAAAQKENFATAGLLKGAGKAAEGMGAIAGHVPGWLLGKGIDSLAGKTADKIMAKTIENRITKLDPNAAGGGVTADEPVNGADTMNVLSGLAPKQRGGPKMAAQGPANLTFRHFSNLTEPRVVLDPAKYGTGLKGAEASRVANGAPKSISLYAGDHPDNMVEPGVRGRTEYRVSVPAKKIYDLSADPKGYLDKAKDFTGAEKMIRSAGYLGYHLPGGEGLYKGQARLFGKTPAVRADTLVPPTGAPRRPLSLSFPRQRGGPKFTPAATDVYWHGSPSGDLRGAKNGLHVGTKEAATIALNARIGVPAKGSWDGTREYGKTKLAGNRTLEKLGPHSKTGWNADAYDADYYPAEREAMPAFADGTRITPDMKPSVEPYRIVGSMTNTPSSALPDNKANVSMRAANTKGNARNGYFYKNESEDAGSISAVVPGAEHLQPLSNTGRLWGVQKYLTPEEKAQLRTDTAQRMVDAFHELPHTNELAAAALAGRAKRGWYTESAKAITNAFGPDAPRFAALLAAMSPQVSVQQNLHNALRSFIGWDKAGRPTDPAAIRQIMEANSLKSPVARSESKSNVLDSWVPNAVRALTDADPEKLTLSGPKVDSFMKNLMGHVNAVTLDAWMASFANVDPNRFAGKLSQSGPGKSPMYLAYSAKVREAAQKLSKLTGDKWTPAEVQETVWSWAKTAYEHADSFGSMASIPELVKNGEVTDELIKSTPAFHDLFSEAGHSASIRDSSFSNGLERLHEGAGSDTGKGAPSEKADAAARTLKPHLYRAAERLEAVRQERRAAKGTRSPLMGDDTEF